MKRFYCWLLLSLLTLMLCLASGEDIIGAAFAKATDSTLTAEPVQADSAQMYFEQGLAAYQAGQFQEAIAHWQQVLDLDNSAPAQAKTLGNLAIAYYDTGQYRRALEANKQAIALFTELDQVTAVGQVQSNLGNVYEALGDYDRAIALYQASLDIARSTQNRLAESISLGNLGYLYSLQGDQSSALAAHEQSLAIAREMGDREGEGHRLLNIGIAYHALNDISQALDHYQQSLEAARASNSFVLEAKALSHLGLAQAQTSDYATAIAYYEESLAIAETLQNPDLIARTLNNLGHTLLAANRLEEAETRLRDAIAQLDTLRSGLTDAYNVAVFDTQIYTYNLLTQILVAQNEPAAALEVAEAGRARAFSELLANRLQHNATSRQVINDRPRSIAELQAIARQTNATFVEYNLVPADDFLVQGRQRGQTAAIHMWVVAPTGKISLRESVIDDDSPALTDLVTASRRAIGINGRGGLGVVQAEETDAPTPDSFRILHQILIDPIADLLPSGEEDRIVFIPQGDLFLVPFPALVDAEGDRLIQHHTILTAPSISVLDLTYQRRGDLRSAQATAAHSPDWLIVGNPDMPSVWNPYLEKMQPLPPLYGAEQEALEVAALFETNALIGPAASESLVKERMATAQNIHLATHGLLAYGDVQSSGVEDVPGAIALAPDAEQDGLLTSAEIFDELTLQADLVVLSACDTGLGTITGDGVAGLSRSLMAAGAPSVIVSLWTVPDAPTAELMIRFYTELKQGQDKAQALRQAMLATLQQYPNPRDWAAFTLIGAS